MIRSTICRTIKNWFIQSTKISFALSFKNKSVLQYLVPLSSHAFFPAPPLYSSIFFSVFSAFTISWFSSQRLNVNPFRFSELHYYLKLIFISTINRKEFLISHQMCFQASIYTLGFVAGIVHGIF